MPTNYILTQDGKLVTVSDELYHANWKYIKREKVKGKWVYTYPDDVKQKNSSSKDETENAKVYSDTIVYMRDLTTKETSNVVAKNTNDTTLVDRFKSWVNKGKELVDKIASKTKAEPKEESDSKAKEEVERKAKEEAERKAKEEADRQAKEEAERKAKEEADRKKKEYEDLQDKERSEVREPELESQLEKLTKKNLFGKLKHNSLPELNLKETATTLDEDMAAINPNYSSDPSSLYNENCAYCSMAYDLRRRGYDVEAGAEFDQDQTDSNVRAGLSTREILELYGVTKILDQNDLIKKGPELAVASGVKPTAENVTAAMEKDMLEQGEGARGIVSIGWSKGGGHAIAWEVVNGKVEFRDCQINKKIEIVDYIKLASLVEHVRTDNLTPTEEIYKYVKNRKAG